MLERGLGQGEPALGLFHVGLAAASGLGAAPHPFDDRSVLTRVFLGKPDDLTVGEYVEVGAGGAESDLFAGVEVLFDRRVGTFGCGAYAAPRARGVVDELAERDVALAPGQGHGLGIVARATGRARPGRRVVGPGPRADDAGIDGRAKTGALLVYTLLRGVVAGARGEHRRVRRDRDLHGIGEGLGVGRGGCKQRAYGGRGELPIRRAPTSAPRQSIFQHRSRDHRIYISSPRHCLTQAARQRNLRPQSTRIGCGGASASSGPAAASRVAASATVITRMISSLLKPIAMGRRTPSRTATS